MWCLWRELDTQWRHAPMGGPVGLDYAAALALIDRRFRHPRQRREAFWLLQAMEDAALAAYRERAAADG